MFCSTFLRGALFQNLHTRDYHPTLLCYLVHTWPTTTKCICTANLQTSFLCVSDLNLFYFAFIKKFSILSTSYQNLIYWYTCILSIWLVVNCLLKSYHVSTTLSHSRPLSYIKAAAKYRIFLQTFPNLTV